MSLVGGMENERGNNIYNSRNYMSLVGDFTALEFCLLSTIVEII